MKSHSMFYMCLTFFTPCGRQNNGPPKVSSITSAKVRYKFLTTFPIEFKVLATIRKIPIRAFSFMRKIPMLDLKGKKEY